MQTIKAIYVAIVIKFMKQFIWIAISQFIWFNLVCSKRAQWLTKDLANEKSYLCCHSDQTYETFHFKCYMLICWIQCSILENMNFCSPNNLANKESNSRCHGDQTYETLHYKYYMLTCLIKFNKLKNVYSG